MQDTEIIVKKSKYYNGRLSSRTLSKDQEKINKELGRVGEEINCLLEMRQKDFEEILEENDDIIKIEFYD